MTIAVGDIIRVTARMQFNLSDEMQNVFYIECQGGTSKDDTDVTAELADWIDDAYSVVAPAMANNITFSQIDFYEVTQDRPLISELWPTVTVGGNAGDALPTQMAAQVNFTTGIKRALGKKYIAGMVESNSEDGGTLTSSLITLLGGWAGFVLTHPILVDMELAAGHVSSVDNNFVEWLNYQVKPLYATQRRRKRGVGA